MIKKARQALSDLLFWMTEWFFEWARTKSLKTRLVIWRLAGAILLVSTFIFLGVFSHYLWRVTGSLTGFLFTDP